MSTNSQSSFYALLQGQQGIVNKPHKHNWCYMASSLQAILRLPNLWGILLAVDIPPEFVMDDDKALRVVTALASIAKDWAQQPRAKTHINAVVKALGKPWTARAQTRNGMLVGQHLCAMEALMEVLGLLSQGLQNFPEDHTTFKTAFGVGLAKFEMLPSGAGHQVHEELGDSHMLSLGLTDHLHSLEAALDFTLFGGTEEDPTGIAARQRDVSRLQMLPLYLVVSTVRTGYRTVSTPQGARSEMFKLNHQLDYPLELDLQRYCTTDCAANSPNTEYTLWGIWLHLGTTLHEGHYVFIQRIASNVWWMRNDAEEVMQMSSQQVYERRHEVIGFVYTMKPPRTSVVPEVQQAGSSSAAGSLSALPACITPLTARPGYGEESPTRVAGDASLAPSTRQCKSASQSPSTPAPAPVRTVSKAIPPPRSPRPLSEPGATAAALATPALASWTRQINTVPQSSSVTPPAPVPTVANALPPPKGPTVLPEPRITAAAPITPPIASSIRHTKKAGTTSAANYIMSMSSQTGQIAAHYPTVQPAQAADKQSEATPDTASGVPKAPSEPEAESIADCEEDTRPEPAPQGQRRGIRGWFRRHVSGLSPAKKGAVAVAGTALAFGAAILVNRRR